MRSLNGQLVRIVGTIDDNLQMEMFGAFKKTQSDENKEDFHLFTDHGVDPQAATEDYVFYERNISLTYLDRIPYSGFRPKISLQELYQGEYETLNQKFTSKNHDIPFFVKTYAAPDNLMLVNRHVEIIGFLNLPQEFEQQEKQGEVYFQNELDPTLHPFFTPIIHAIRVQPVEPFANSIRECEEAKVSKGVSKRIIELASQVCRGDKTFGQLMLHSILSLVSGRPHSTPIDFISLNLYNIMEDKTVKDIKQFITLLAPRPLFQETTIGSLSKEKLFGKKNYELNCIEQGLPLPDGTTLVLDETGIEAGTLHEVGVKNVTMLSNIIGLQKRFYDFEFCPFEADCNITVIGLSRSKSIFEFENRVA